ncbi:MAG: site-specific integrase [Parabacteroides sp.]|nr:site-specific integrase [Parabacteroides sp.]
MTTSVKLKKKKSVVAGKRMPLYFQVISHRETKRIVLDLKLSEDEWEPETASIRLPPDAESKRITYLLSAREEVERHYKLLSGIIGTLEEKEQLTAGHIIAAYRMQTQTVGWLDYMQDVIDRKRIFRSESTVSNYKSTLSAFSHFLAGKTLSVDEVDETLLKEFEAYLLARHLSMNTVSFYFRILRSVWNQAVADGLIAHQPSPFHDVCTRIEKTDKRAINEEAIKKLKALSLDDSSGLSLSRDLFLFCYYARGMTFIDLVYLTSDNIKGKKLVYVRRKTGQKLEIELLPVMIELLRKYRRKGQKYLFPVLKADASTFRDYTSALRLYNKRLKKLGKMIGCYLSSYVARHSWVSIAYRRGIDEEIISKSMGHTSVQTTRIYIASLDNRTIDRANRVVIMGKQHQRSIYKSRKL